MTPVYAFAGDTPAIHDSAFIAPSASVIGKATMAQDSSAFYGVSVRADTAAISVGPAPSARGSASATAPWCTAARWRTTA